MTIFEKLLIYLVATATMISVNSANMMFSGSKIPQNSTTLQYQKDLEKYTNNIISQYFPTGNVDNNFVPPYNLPYTISEFQKFKNTYLTAAPKVSDSYFNDTLFLGDSLTYGLNNTQLPTDKVLGIIGIQVYNILDTETSYTDSEKETVEEWLRIIQPKKLYINLGTNAVKGLGNEQHINFYKNFLDRVESVCPNSQIILVGISPWGAKASGSLSVSELNTKINHFNMYLLELAQARGYYYVNACEALMNGRGELADEYNSGDGLHWNFAGQKAYMDYIKTHPIA